MNKLFVPINKILRSFVNMRAAGIYLLLFAVSIGVATFIENDFGTSSAQKIVYQSWWFELLLVLFAAAIIVNIFRFKMIKLKKWAVLLFHASIIIILIGAAVTRFFGTEGIMHIRENNTSNSFLSSNSFLKFRVIKNNEIYNFDEPVLFATLGNNNWSESYLVNNDLVEVKVKEFIPNPKQIVTESSDGLPTLKVVVSGMNGREEYFISEGEVKQFGNVTFNFTNNIYSGAINISYKNDSLLFNSDRTFTQMVMATQKKDTIYPSGGYKPLMLRSLYSDGKNNFVMPEFNKKGKISIESQGPKVKNESVTALLMDISVNGKTQETMVYERKGAPGEPNELNFDGLSLSVAYGSKEVVVPFSIKLNDFIMDKYPGTNSASSYASEVQLIDDKNNVKKDYRIYMNHILDYRGYRFFQSSFDQDEQGTYLSVNNDFWGTLISYIGYILLTIGMIWTLFNKKTRFHQVIQSLNKLREKGTAIAILMLLSSTISFAQSGQNDENVQHAVGLEHADKFSRLIVQDFRGRMKPVHTLSREILRKISRKESLFGLTADQILLSLFVNSNEWVDVKMIKLGKHPDVQKVLGVNGGYASFRDFFSENGEYKLASEMQKINGMNPTDRAVYEKELLKIDERVNILNMAFSGGLLKIIPNPDDPNNTWLSYRAHNHEDMQNNPLAEKFFSAYGTALKTAIATNNYSYPDSLLNELKDYQYRKGGKIVPSPSKINAEIFLNNAKIFSRLAILYILLGITFLFFLFLSVFKPNIKLRKIHKVLFSLVVLGFVFHTIGLGLRWFISERAPWSNGYESMIYIAWTSTLAGILFTRKSFGGLAATMVLAATILLVSMLSFLDPEITPLAPVLKSYWLTIHVSMEAGSYGFLVLGAIIGLINLILMVVITESNKDRIKRIIKEMSYISELTMIGGLFMLSIGTYLGGVWANESWGRYWGWDAKETWALVSVLVYAFILHMRMIPKLKGLFAYNLASVFGLASIIMTYFGVNYYLSGLHSYATGDPIPIPGWVYIAVVLVVMISLLAYLKKRKYKNVLS